MKVRRQSTPSSFFFLILVSTFFFGIFAAFDKGQIFQSKPKEEVAAASSCQTEDLSGNLDPTATVAYFEGKEIAVTAFGSEPKKQVLGTSSSERWMEVDISEQKLKAWEGDSLFLETSISTGLAGTPTPLGEFRIWTKLRATKMSGGEGKNYYYLPNVPFVMFFEGSGIPNWKGYGLHGTYWHNDFGNRRSHGCVNLPTPVAEKLYYWVSPNLPEGKNSVRATGENPGTRIVIHE